MTMDANAIAEAARWLVERRSEAPRYDGLPESCKPATLADAHAIQNAAAALLDDPVAGWKVGKSPDGKIAHGALLRSRVLADGAHVDAATMPLLGVESEVPFRLARDLPSRTTPYSYEEVADAVVAFPGIEIVDSRFRGYPKPPFLDRLADFMSNGAFVCGRERADWRSLDLAKLEVELTIGGNSIVRSVGGHTAGDPLLPALAWINERRAGLRAGQIITTGTYTGLHFAQPGQTAVATFTGFGSVTVHFDAPRT